MKYISIVMNIERFGILNSLPIYILVSSIIQNHKYVGSIITLR